MRTETDIADHPRNRWVFFVESVPGLLTRKGGVLCREGECRPPFIHYVTPRGVWYIAFDLASFISIPFLGETLHVYRNDMYISMHSRCGISHRSQVPSLTNLTPCTFSRTGIPHSSHIGMTVSWGNFWRGSSFTSLLIVDIFRGAFGDEGSY